MDLSALLLKKELDTSALFEKKEISPISLTEMPFGTQTTTPVFIPPKEEPPKAIVPIAPLSERVKELQTEALEAEREAEKGYLWAGFKQGTKEIAKEIGQSIMRNISSFVGSEALEPIVKPITTQLAKIEGKYPTYQLFTQELANRLYGELISPEITELTGETRAEQLAPIGERVVKLEDKLKQKSKKYQKLATVPNLNTRERLIISLLGDILDKQASPIAFLTIGGYIGLDLTWWGGSKKGVEQTIKTANKLGDAYKILMKMGLSDDLVKQFASDVVKVKTDKEAKLLFESIVNIQLKTKAVKSVVPTTKGIKEVVPEIPEKRLLPAVIRGETFTLGEQKVFQPTIKELKDLLKTEIKATKKEIKNAEIAAKKAAQLEAKEQKMRIEAMENIQRFRGNTDNIIESLKSRHLSDEDIANVILEDGTKLTDTVRVKRNPDGSLATIIKKSELEKLKASYTEELPKMKWAKRSKLVEGIEVPIKMAKSIELPYVWFERKGLSELYDLVIQAGRDAEMMKTQFLQRFKDAELFKEGGWFTADRFKLSKNEAEGVAKYYLGRQGKGKEIALTELSEKSRKFIEVFDDIIKETEPRFFEIAKLNGKIPGKVKNYAPIMTSKDIKLIDQKGSMDWLFRNHPAFFSLKERAKKVPIELYELDYKKVAARWLDGITDFLNYGETTPRIKYLINSDQFKEIVKESDWQFISNWLKDITTKEIPSRASEQALTTTSKFLRKGVAMGTLGLNYASVAKQALTQIPIMIINKSLPKFRSKYAEAFGINIAHLPSITKRRGDIAIVDLQGKVGRIFTGPLTRFDKTNAQWSLNGLIDKELDKLIKEGVEVTPEVLNVVLKKTQDILDMWYGGFFKGQRPEAFRKELGNFILMFLYPLTSQLNGFYRHILTAQGVGKVKAGAEVLAAATAIAYMEQVIENLSPQWSDEVEMTRDTLQSLAGNIPVISDIIYAILNEKEMQISPVIGNVNNIIRNIGKEEYGKAGWAIAETFGTPKQIRRIKEGMEIMEMGGITDDEGKMLAPVQDVMELIRSFLRGKYGSIAAQDWIRNIGEKSVDRRWFVTEVEFLQNGDYERKAELYRQFDAQTQKELYDFLSENQQKKLDNELKKGKTGRTLEEIFGEVKNKKTLEEIFKY
jgi:hypothetical protein